MTAGALNPPSTRRIIWLSDLQTRLLPTLLDAEGTVDRIKKTISDWHNDHIVLTEHLKEKLGPFNETILDTLYTDHPNYDLFQKSTFSAHDQLLPLIDKFHSDEVVICGAETHICVFQTALYLTHYRPTLRVTILTDLVTCSSPSHKNTALKLLQTAQNVKIQPIDDATADLEMMVNMPSHLLFKLRHPDTEFTSHRLDSNRNNVLDIIDSALATYKLSGSNNYPPPVPNNVEGVLPPIRVMVCMADCPPHKDNLEPGQLIIAIVDGVEDKCNCDQNILKMTAEMLLFGLAYDANSRFFKTGLKAVKEVKKEISSN